MSDAAELVRLIKKAAVDAVEAEKPAAVCFGKVVSTVPLKILVEQRLTLGENQLILTGAVKNHYADVYFSGFTNTDAFMNAAHRHIISGSYGGSEVFTCDSGNLDTTHRHGFSGRKKILIYNGLKEGENVILLRAEGGQRFIVLDRLCDAATEGEWVK